MTTIEVPLSSPMFQYLERGELDAAYAAACLGVTESDMRALGRAALERMDLEVARKAFSRLKDLRYLELIEGLTEERGRKGSAATSRKGSAASQGGVESGLADFYAFEVIDTA